MAYAAIISRGIRSLPILKCSSERWVWAPQSLSAGTFTSPRLSVSLRMSVILFFLSPAGQQGSSPANGPTRRLLLPASAEGPVKLHETLVLGAARLCKREFSRKERPLPVQHFEIRCRPSLVAQVGKAHGFLQVLDGVLLANPHLMEFLVTDQRIGHIAERALNGLPVRNQSLLLL